MSKNDDVIIVGSLDKKELEKSIQDLVDYVGNKTNDMASNFTQGLDKMKLAMKDFAVTQKVSVDVMKEAWRNMSSSFDAMVAAQSTATGSSNGGGSGGGKPQYPDNTVGHLEETIRLEEKRRKEMQLNSDELRQQNKLLEDQKNKLKEQTTSEQIKNQKLFAKDLGAANAMSTKTLQQAEDKLKRLIDLQNKFKGTGLVDEAKMNRLQSAIDNVRTKIERLKQTAPKSIQDVLGMDEDSVDAIARKMRALKALTIDPNNAQQVKLLGDEYQRLSRLQSVLLGRNIQATHSNNMLAQSFGYIRNRIVYALTLGAITNFTKQIYEIRGQYELLERSLGVLVNSFEKGSQIFQELNTMAIESPFTLMELAGAAKQLTAYNFEANEVVDTTRRLADISAALGVPMERLVYNLGQIRAQTVLTARDARDFANAGLPIVKSLSDYYTELEGKVVSTGDVYDRMSKKMVSYTDVMSVLNKMTDQGGKFFEFQAKQAETLRVQMANLTLAYNNMLNEMGKSNQTLLSLPIKGLKALLQNWSSVNRVLKNVILSLGILKVAQMIAIRNNYAWAASAGHTAKMMGFLANTIKGLAASMYAMAANPWTWVFVGLFAITDLIGKMRAAKQATAELNEEIRNGATEASQANLDFLGNKGNKATLELAKQNKLTAEQGEKAWQSIEQQISTSAMSANKLLGELWAIDDINERVRKGFEYTESIQKAQAALQDLQDDTIELTSDKGWGGIFGEGLVSDLKDLQEELGGIAGGVGLFDNEGKLKDVSGGFVEYREELEKTAESINNFIIAHKITDPLQINEILERVKAVIKTKNPEIKGELATLFDVTLDQRMMFLTNGAINQNTSLWKMFLDRLKHNSSATFQGITDEIYTESGKLTKEQQNAVDSNLEYFKNTMPWYYDAIKDMVDDASQLRVQIGIAFNVQTLTDFQKQVQERIGKAPKTLSFGNDSMLPTQNDNLQTWVKTQQDAIKALQEQNKLYAKDSSQWSKDQIKANDTEIQQRKNLLDLFNQSYEKEKKTRGKTGAQKDPLGDALQKEIQLINDIQKTYKEYRKAGVDAETAKTAAANEYTKSLQTQNATLKRFGIKGFTGEQLATMDLRGIRDYYQSMLDVASKLNNVKGVEALEKALRGINVEITKLDYKKITEGLNSELGKLKDEYELAVELDANPEIGNMFADMFGINTSTLPKTFGDALDRAQIIINRKLAELKISTPFDLMQSNVDDFAKSTGLDKESEAIKELAKWQNTFHDMFKKNITETEKILDDYIKKYGDYSDKIAEIEASRLEKLKKLNEAYYTEEMRKRPEYVAKLNAIEQGANKEKQQVDFDEFKNSRYYTMMFENLDYISTKTIRDMRDRVRELMDTMNDLTPEQLKTLISQYEKLEQKLVKRSPFKTLTKDLKEYFSTSKERNAANQEFKNAQKEYDAQKKNVAALKEKYEQAKANSNTSKSYLDFLQIEIGGENEILQILKQQLDAAQKKADKYNLTAKLAKSEALAVAQVVSSNLQSLGELRDFLQQDLGVELSDELNGLVDGLSKVGQGINKITSSATSGDVVGVITGVGQTIYGLYDGIASIFGGGSTSDKKITKQIQDSEQAVKRLEIAYKNLEVAIENAYGTNVIGAKQAAIANKELQLAELNRQLALEKSRKSKHRDEDRIIGLQGQIIDLKNDIKKSSQEIALDLLGISSVADEAMTLMDAYIDALRKGEDAQKAFSGSFKEMILNMLKSIWVTKVIGPELEALVDDLNERLKNRSKIEAEAYEKAVEEQSRRETMSDDEIRKEIAVQRLREQANDKNQGGQELIASYYNLLKEVTQDEIDSYKRYAEKATNDAKKSLNNATVPTIEDLDLLAQSGLELLPKLESMNDVFYAMLERYDLFDKDSSSNLSALQQGIQGITEDTAGALESYLNGVSQQVYLQSDILTQIRDTILGFELDAQVATLSQMLLQLQQSYVVQQNIENLLQNVINPSGRAFMVELAS